MARQVDLPTGFMQHRGRIRCMDTVRHRGVDRGSAEDLVVVGSDVDVVAASDGGAAAGSGGDCRSLQ